MVPTSGASEAQTARGDSELQPVPDAGQREGAAVRGAETEQPTTVRGNEQEPSETAAARRAAKSQSNQPAELSTLWAAKRDHRNKTEGTERRRK